MDELIYSGVFRTFQKEGSVKVLDNRKLEEQQKHRRKIFLPFNDVVSLTSFVPSPEILNDASKILRKSPLLKSYPFQTWTQGESSNDIESEKYSAKIIGGGEEIRLSWIGLNPKRVLGDGSISSSS